MLHFQMIGPDELSQPVLLVAKMFAEQVSLSIANIRLREELRNQSIRDPLTGLYNRRYLEETMEREIRRAVRSEQGLGVLMLDLDHFQKFNDTHGHDAGDTVLRETAWFLLKSVRAEDLVCRFGGEEFVVILPVADLKVTQARAERIRTKLHELTVMHQGQSEGMVTVSVGVAELPQHGTSHHELLGAADAALYRAKREGRDRVAVAKTPLASELKLSWRRDSERSAGILPAVPRASCPRTAGAEMPPRRRYKNAALKKTGATKPPAGRLGVSVKSVNGKSNPQLRCPRPLLSSLAMTPSLM